MPTMRAAEGQKLAEEHLALANRHIAEAKERIARQSALRDPDDNLVEFTVYDR